MYSADYATCFLCCQPFASRCEIYQSTRGDDLKAVIGLLQLPVTAIIVAISVEDSAAMKAGKFLADKKKGEGES